jgi:hypothetical protein
MRSPPRNKSYQVTQRLHDPLPATAPRSIADYTDEREFRTDAYDRSLPRDSSRLFLISLFVCHCGKRCLVRWRDRATEYSDECGCKLVRKALVEGRDDLKWAYMRIRTAPVRMCQWGRRTSAALHTSFSNLHRTIPSGTAPAISSMYFSSERVSMSLRIWSRLSSPIDWRMRLIKAVWRLREESSALVDSSELWGISMLSFLTVFGLWRTYAPHVEGLELCAFVTAHFLFIGLGSS